RAIDFRVSTCPTLFGEKIVLRILDPAQAQLGIESLGYEPFQKELYLKYLAKPQGMILVTGPTGSGKTVSLYTGLAILNREDTNISTAEDPAEINLPGVNQVNVNPKVGLTFAAAMQSLQAATGDPEGGTSQGGLYPGRSRHRNEDLRAQGMCQLHRRLQGPGGHLSGVAGHGGDRAHHSRLGERAGDWRAGCQGRRMGSAARGSRESEERYDQSRGSQQRHGGVTQGRLVTHGSGSN